MSKNNLLLSSNQLLVSQNETFRTIVEHLKQKARIAKNAILLYSNEEYSSMDPLNRSIIIKGTMHDLIFFPDEAILEKYQQLGVTSFVLLRFVPLQDILTQLDLIGTDSAYVFDKQQALSHIIAYVQCKINQELRQIFVEELQNLHPKEKLNEKQYLHNITRTRIHNGGAPRNVKDPIKQAIHEQIDRLRGAFSSEKKAEIFIKKLLHGKIDGYYLTQLTKISVPYQDSTQYYAKFFELFKLIVTDKYWPSREDFIDNNGYWGRTYEWYRGDLVRKFIRGISSDFGSLHAKNWRNLQSNKI